MSFLSGTRSQTISLPPEILMSIFQLATYNSTREIDRLIELPPFEGIYADNWEEQDKQAVLTKHALVLTCSFFHRLATRLLYEDVWVRHGSEALLGTLRDSRVHSAGGYGLGRFVKRITLPPAISESAAQIIPHILSLCPTLRMLCWPSPTTSEGDNYSASVERSLNTISFSQLHRIDWSITSFNEVSASNISPGFVWHSPCLRALSLDDASVFIPDHVLEHVGEPQILIDLPQLHTLRLRSCGIFTDTEESWLSVHFPSLRRIVLESPLTLYALHAGCLSSLGSQIKVLELGQYPRFLRIDAISDALGYCPNVETLNFPAFSTIPPAKNRLDTPRTEWLEYRVKHVGLNASVEEDWDYQVSRTWMRVQLGDLVDALFGEGTRFTELRRITLYGSEWRELVQDEAFRPIAKAIVSSRVEIDCEDDVTEQLVQNILG